MREFKFLKKWKCPSSGFIMWNHEDLICREASYVVLGKHRDSDILTETNFTVALERLQALETKLGGSNDEIPWVRVERDSSDLVGWIEHIYIADDAPEELLDYAEDMLRKLDGYPVLDEDRWSQAENDAIYDYWKNASDREKIDLIVEHCDVDEERAMIMLDTGDFPEEVENAMRDWGW